VGRDIADKATVAARDTLNFRPTHSDLATIIRTAWAWHNKAHPLIKAA
jgi:UDP-glucose 4-epimerase